MPYLRFASRSRSQPHRRAQRTIEIADQVVRILDPDGQPDQVVRDTGRMTVLHGELLVRGAPRMDDQALRIADVRDEREQAHTLDHPPRSLLAAQNAEREHA